MLWLLVIFAACVPEGKPPLHNHSGLIGDGCMVRDDCSGNLACMTGDFFDFSGLATPGGYCTHTCTSDSDCNGQACIGGGASSHYCVVTCNDASGCRSGYACFQPGWCEPGQRSEER